MILIILFCLSLVLNIALVYLLIRAAWKLVQFDDLFTYLVDDIDINIRYFDKLIQSPTLIDSPEIKEAQRNMSIMSKRLAEYVLRMEELLNKKLVKRRTSPNPPVVA